MTLLSGSPEERLALHIDRTCHDEITATFDVIETDKKGRARVACHLRATDRGWQWKIGHPKEFAGLKLHKSADGVVVVRHGDAHTTVHIMECKKTIHPRKLDEKVKPQLLGSLLRTLALTTIAGIDIDDAVFYIAFHNDQTLEDPVNSKLPIDAQLPQAQRDVIRQIREWNEELPFTLTGVAADKFAVRRVKLDENPDDPDESIGSVTLEPRVL